jgi:hypothetical protein
MTMRGTTTNEELRHRWNATRPPEQRIKANTREKFHHFYWAQLPESRIEKFYQLRSKALKMKDEERDSKFNQSMISFTSVASAQHSQAGGGFDFDERDLGTAKISKHLKRMQNELLQEVDNYTLLLDYNIQLPDRTSLAAESQLL